MLGELLFWMDKGAVKCILPQNIKDEWERSKSKKIEQAKKKLLEFQKSVSQVIKDSKALREAVSPDKFEAIALDRIARLDNIFSLSEVAPISDELLLEAGKRNLAVLAPNHTSDSFRDTVNILSLISFIKSKGYTNCHFVSENSKDFSDPTAKSKLHGQLKDHFDSVGLAYTCEIRVLLDKLRSTMPSYLDFLKEQRLKQASLEVRDKAVAPFLHEDLDNEFLDHLPYIDSILSKQSPTGFEKTMLNTLMQSHPSYRRYVFSKMQP